MVSWTPRRIVSRGGARSGRGGEAPRLGELENTMTTEQKIIRAKVGLLELAKQLGNVSQASLAVRRMQPSRAIPERGCNLQAAPAK